MRDQVTKIPSELTSTLVPIVTGMRTGHADQGGDNGDVTGGAAEEVVHAGFSEQPVPSCHKKLENEGRAQPRSEPAAFSARKLA